MSEEIDDRSGLTRGKYRHAFEKVTEELHMTFTDYKVTIGPDATEDDIVEGMRRIRSMNQENGVVVKFYLGDLYNQIPRQYGARKQLVEAEFGESFYNLLRGYACVAKRWPAHKRTGKYAWKFFKENGPEGKISKDTSGERPPETLTTVSVTRFGDGSEQRMLSDGKGKLFLCVIDRDREAYEAEHDDSKPISGEWFDQSAAEKEEAAA